ncbi:4a-hydroxytetrahydrobiopterin dehydratase [Ilumatobacter fluminis]|uniref:Putative pterin-4-alpha-carbinolamine dehydratase n=1 Tax=Ilumatobacter fluminis TaxID=467091 RepID=A0A4R7I2L5_9ACTN|nr:VOC family protein [Ilumatobacter fluminis]TDT16783.1 4a-hydroxytetrahydrobiopterin dehydratase [Ilumatobacter fluminis]
MSSTLVPPAEIAADATLGDWRYGVGAIRAEFVATSFPGGAALLAEIAAAAEAADHHPALHLRWPGAVRVELWSHDAGGVTDRDVDLARTISGLAAVAGAEARPLRVQAVEWTIDTEDADRIRPFWLAVLGYSDDPAAFVDDPAGFGPAILFQPMGDGRTQRNRIHVDISVPHDVAERRVAEALAAGGTLVSDEHARAWWVLADADGNEACICTWQDR